MHRGRTVKPHTSLLDALKKMDALDKKLLIVLENKKFHGLLSAGDIQRAIIQNLSLNTYVTDVIRTNIKIARPTDSYESVREMMLTYRMELCPVVDENQQITDVYYWEDIFKEKEPAPKNRFDLPVVIMAGGFGSRLKPLTNVLPKPLIPLGEKTILELIFDKFYHHGCSAFHLSLNYKAELIEYYINNLKLPYDINFFIEKKPMGTAGSLTLLKNKINQTFFVNNCDILIEQDYSEILDYHRENKNEITIVAALKHLSIPYGTVESTKKGKLVKLTEKPELLFKINSGMYILEPALLNEIPENQFYHITQLIEKVNKRGGKVGVFPVSEKSWKDIGEWDEYLKQMKDDL